LKIALVRLPDPVEWIEVDNFSDEKKDTYKEQKSPH